MKRQREFRFSQNNFAPLSSNLQHKFAASYALCIYMTDSIYTFIPKNACSTMRLSLAIKNGLISNINQFKWIHSNNHTFSASLSDLVKAKYTFVILRNPYLRIASAYLDIFVNKKPGMWSFTDFLEEKIDVDKLNFLKFLKIIDSQKKLLSMNIHWVPQINFLVYTNYDSYIQFEKFEEEKKIIEKKCDIKIYDARKLILHGNDLYKQISDKSYAEIDPIEIYNLRKNGKSPTETSMHNEETKKIISSLYRYDVLLYNKCFNTDCSRF